MKTASGVYAYVARIVFNGEANSDYVMRSLATKIDMLHATLVKDAQFMAEKFTSYADTTARFPLEDDTCPVGYSTIQDLERNSAVLRALREQFIAMAGAMLSDERFAELQDLLRRRALECDMVRDGG